VVATGDPRIAESVGDARQLDQLLGLDSMNALPELHDGLSPARCVADVNVAMTRFEAALLPVELASGDGVPGKTRRRE
jgi:hypothetical protein